MGAQPRPLQEVTFGPNTLPLYHCTITSPRPHPPPPRHVIRLADVFDDDGNGVISPDELYNFCQFLALMTYLEDQEGTGSIDGSLNNGSAGFASKAGASTIQTSEVLSFEGGEVSGGESEEGEEEEEEDEEDRLAREEAMADLLDLEAEVRQSTNSSADQTCSSPTPSNHA